jgi:hypothetical protein
MRRQSLKRSLIERFAESSHPGGAEELERATDRPAPNTQVRRFMKMVAVRKQQMLEKLLFEQP